MTAPIHRYRGFTLLELLIAIAIFSLLATGCYRLFKSVSGTHEVTTSLWQQTGELQKALLILQKDFSQLVVRPIRNEFGDYEAAVLTAPKTLVTLTKGGWRNFTGAKRSDLQRVRYVLDGGQLLRRYWETLDRAPDTPYREQVVLDDVQDFTLKFRDDKKRWHTTWPPVSDKQSERLRALPTAIEYTLIHERVGKIQQLVSGPTYKIEDKKSPVDPNDKGNNTPSDNRSLPLDDSNTDDAPIYPDDEGER